MNANPFIALIFFAAGGLCLFGAWLAHRARQRIERNSANPFEAAMGRSFYDNE